MDTRETEKGLANIPISPDIAYKRRSINTGSIGGIVINMPNSLVAIVADSDSQLVLGDARTGDVMEPVHQMRPLSFLQSRRSLPWIRDGSGRSRAAPKSVPGGPGLKFAYSRARPDLEPCRLRPTEARPGPRKLWPDPPDLYLRLARARPGGPILAQ